MTDRLAAPPSIIVRLRAYASRPVRAESGRRAGAQFRKAERKEFKTFMSRAAKAANLA
jgi:hypothetical protein